MTEQEIAAYKEQVFSGNGQSNIQPPTPPPIDTPPVSTDTPPVVDIPPVVQTPDITKDAPVTDLPPAVKNELKDNLGFENWESAKATIEELRLKSETPAEITFANEQSQRLFAALKEGKVKEVRQFLDTQDKIESFSSVEVNEENAPDIIKLGMELKYKAQDLSPKEIEHKFNKEFGLPKEPVWDKAKEDEDEFNEKHDEWKEKVDDVKMNRSIEAKLAKQELLKAKVELVLPDISKPAVDADYEQYKAQRTSQPEKDAETLEAYSKISPKDVAMVFKFSDEATKLAFDISYEPDKESFDKAVATASDLKQFLSNYLGKDGSPDRTRFLKDLYVGQNVEKLVSEAAREAVTQTKAWFLRNQKNIGDGTQKNYVMPPQSDIDKLREQVFGKTG